MSRDDDSESEEEEDEHGEKRPRWGEISIVISQSLSFEPVFIRKVLKKYQKGNDDILVHLNQSSRWNLADCIKL